MAGLLSGLFGAQPQAQAPGQSINGQSLLQKLLDPSFAMPIASALMQRGQGNAANFGDAFGAAGQAMAQKAQTNKTLQHLRKEAPDLAADVDAGLPIGEAWKVYTEQRYAQKGKKGLINAGDGQLYNQDTGEWLTAPGGGDDFAKRKAAADTYGLSPDDPAYKSFLLTGKMPREDQAPLTATDKKAILEADEAVQANQNAIDMLSSVVSGAPGQSINDKASYGLGADTQAWLARNDPTGFFDDEKGQATTELNNVVLNQALSTLKSTFGAAPTEGERKILVDLQASVDKSPAERKLIIERGMELARKRLAFNQQRADELRGGTFYKQGGGASNGGAEWRDLGGGVSIRRLD